MDSNVHWHGNVDFSSCEGGKGFLDGRDGVAYCEVFDDGVIVKEAGWWECFSGEGTESCLCDCAAESLVCDG